jgi:gluconate 2-dehydrogenase gamma chain
MSFLLIKSFFDIDYRTPIFLKKKQLSRRALLKVTAKSAAGMGAVPALSVFSLSLHEKKSLVQLAQTDPWLTLDATLNHLLPKSETGPSAKDIHALAYLHQVMTVHPTEEDEKSFILKGVGWLNSYANSEKNKAFVALTFEEKELLLKGISQSTAGSNWLNTLLSYILEAMLAPPSYSGNGSDIGWQWLEHKAGFPLPEKGQRYFELPARANIIKLTRLTAQERK